MALSRSLTKKFQKLSPKNNWTSSNNSSKKQLGPAVDFNDDDQFYSIRFEHTAPSSDDLVRSHSLSYKHQPQDELMAKSASVLTVNVCCSQQDLLLKSSTDLPTPDNASIDSQGQVYAQSHSPHQHQHQTVLEGSSTTTTTNIGAGGTFTPPLAPVSSNFNAGSGTSGLVLDEYFPPYQSMILAQQQLQEQQLQEQQAAAGQRVRSSTSSSANPPAQFSIPSTPIVTSTSAASASSSGYAASGYATPPLSISTAQSSNPASPVNFTSSGNNVNVNQVYPSYPSKPGSTTNFSTTNISTFTNTTSSATSSITNTCINNTVCTGTTSPVVATPMRALDSNIVAEAATVVLGHKTVASASSSNYSTFSDPLEPSVGGGEVSEAQKKALEEEAQADQMALDILEKVRAEDYVEEIQSEGAWCI